MCSILLCSGNNKHYIYSRKYALPSHRLKFPTHKYEIWHIFHLHFIHINTNTIGWFRLFFVAVEHKAAKTFLNWVKMFGSSWNHLIYVRVSGDYFFSIFLPHSFFIFIYFPPSIVMRMELAERSRNEFCKNQWCRWFKVLNHKYTLHLLEVKRLFSQKKKKK